MTDVLKQIEVMEKRIAELKVIAATEKQKSDQKKVSGKDDAALLHDCLDLIQQATYHDGRYEQYKSGQWQNKGQSLVQVLAKRLSRAPYEGY
jgi:hypothetical protein